MKFRDLPDNEQKARFEKVQGIFAKFDFLKTRTQEPLDGLFGKYNLGALTVHAAFVSDCALIALFDGISGKLKVYDKLIMCYGGLNFEQSDDEFDVETQTDDILNKIHQIKLIISALKEN